VGTTRPRSHLELCDKFQRFTRPRPTTSAQEPNLKKEEING
jgi:hypothetical protein